ncbi:OPI3 [Candida oxycetoniae]|uniref:Phosphatidyl-N-methylethanolamine N-methyltransferase n=1 Tax=Candida oxycetoniae TaxID=497107 RepID=A0AAI9WZK0_9ASCO|nr:OPI3 [Candida oxycetoniae]KAI3406144.1 OPI3 [Candida oxycetoniae]
MSSQTDLTKLTQELNTLVQDIQFLVRNLPYYITINQELLYTIACISFNPIFWNVVARLEYRTHFITKIVGSARRGCYLLALVIFSLGVYRDHVYRNCLLNQPTYQPLVDSTIVKSIAMATFGFGNVLVISSMWALRITGTYLGDYFGILMKQRVTNFPFNINDNPMYNGSTLCFLGTALWYGKPAGIAISLFVFIMYKVALMFEEPFTAKIYANRAKLD